LTGDVAAQLAGSEGVVTGASGFIGRGVLGALPAGCRVHAVYNSSSDFEEWAARQRADIVPLRVDLSRDRLADFVPRADWALLMAARVATAASLEDPVGELTAVTAVTANSVVGLEAEQMVLLSSGSVYETLTGALSPDRVLAPRLPYSISKLAAELLFAAYASGPYWVVRFFGAFGPGEPTFKLARRLVEAFAAGETAFTLSGDGTNVIDPMYIDDAARALIGVLGTPGQSRPADLNQGEGLSVGEFANVAYEAVSPEAGTAPLRLDFVGVAHEKMLGRATTDAAFAVGVDRTSIAEGFRRYAAELGVASGGRPSTR
jgi:nucleoside-diphosphate-sugar epimerase